MPRDDMAVGLSHFEIKATATICQGILLPDKELSSFGTKRSVVQIHSARLEKTIWPRQMVFSLRGFSGFEPKRAPSGARRAGRSVQDVRDWRPNPVEPDRQQQVPHGACCVLNRLSGFEARTLRESSDSIDFALREPTLKGLIEVPYMESFVDIPSRSLGEPGLGEIDERPLGRYALRESGTTSYIQSSPLDDSDPPPGLQHLRCLREQPDRLIDFMERGNEDGEVRAADIEPESDVSIARTLPLGPALGSNLCAT